MCNILVAYFSASGETARLAGTLADAVGGELYEIKPAQKYEAPRIIQTFLESYDFSGKTVVPFCTSGGSGLGNTVDILKESCCAETNWKPGRRFSPYADKAELKAWTESLGL